MGGAASVDEPRPGDHACLTYSDAEERLDIVVTLAFAAKAHSRAVAPAVYYEDSLLRICRQHAPPGIRLAGASDQPAVRVGMADGRP